MASSVDFISGCVGGAAGVLIGHPLDTVKVIMQTSSKQTTLRSVMRNCSISSLYQGIKAPLSGLTAINAIVFGVHGSIMRFCPEESQRQKLIWCGVAGSCAGLAQSFISSPIELVKTRAQLNAVPIWQLTKQVLKTEGGLKGLYRGFWITVARDCPAFATYFLSFEWLMGRLRNSDQRPSTADMLIAGGSAGAISWLAIYPLDVVKSRIQADRSYTSALQCFRHLVKSEGVGVLMRGCSPTLLRAFPSNAATFAMVTWTLYAIELYRIKTHFAQE